LVLGPAAGRGSPIRIPDPVPCHATAADAHYRSEAFARYQEQIGALLVRSSELRVFTVTAGLRPVDSSPIAISQDD
jgi:hypothetical protein